MFKNLDSDVLIGNCPYCQSKESFKYKSVKGWMFLCHDCQRHVSVSILPQEKIETITSQIRFDNLLSLCTKLSNLPSDHVCIKYVEGRKIPKKYFDKLYYTERFKDIAQTVDRDASDSPRLVIPFFNESGEMFAMQGRALDDDPMRYITLVFNKEEDLLFGRDRVDLSKSFKVVEGPIDSLFLENTVATAGIGSVPNKYIPNAVICLDNEPRNRDIVKIIKKNIDKGFSVVIWPDNIKHKDINDMVLNGIQVEEVINNNTTKGMSAILKLNNWKKI